ncbi:12541_t:CDS:1 [Dentiscutata erythropus]|uniref:12541_t:CDS:1 n=1 Tax=Dentiscutata erythropus TaxID=1348616 RepID=A0A9N9DGM6_9GLOM|nr:12541_t:CDS:1 [Dentiscutata erythropus]
MSDPFKKVRSYCFTTSFTYLISITYVTIFLVFVIHAFRDIENAFWTKGINDFILKEINIVIHITIYLLYFISLGGVLLLLLPFLDKSVQKGYEDCSPIISFLINISVIILSSYGYKRQIVDEKYNLSSSPFFQAMIIFSVGRASHNILTQVLHRVSIKRYEKDLESLQQPSNVPVNSYSIFQTQQLNNNESSIESFHWIYNYSKMFAKTELFRTIYYLIFPIISLALNLQSMNNANGNSAQLLLKGIIHCNIFIITNSIVYIINISNFFHGLSILRTSGVIPLNDA